jgi:surface protein
MSEMFRLCKKLKSLDLSTFDTSNVNDMNGMFSGCEELESLDLSNFDTSNVKMMYYMFHGCSELESVDLSSFDTSKVNSMVGMFEYCYKLTTLDLSSFNTVYVCAIENMFMNCHELKTIYVGANWINDGIVVPEKIFSGCDRLTGGNGTKFDDDKVSTEYAHVDEAGNPGYFSAHEGVSLEIPAKLKSTRVTDGMLTYRVFADHAEVLKCAEDAEGEIVIAEDIEGKPVTKIGNTAFYMCKELTSVVMPDTIKEIGRGAFADMKLNEIILSSSLEIIDDIVFTHCNFGSIEFPDTLKSIGAEAFEFCNFENVVIPASVERIMAYTFSGSRINTMTVLNPECEIYDNQETLGSPRSIKGYKGSTAEAYAKKYDIKFIDIDEKLPVWGDANCDGGVDMADIVLIMQSLANPNRYGIEGTDEHHITVEGQTYADVSRGSDYEANGITGEDALEIQRYLLGKISSLVPKMP